MNDAHRPAPEAPQVRTLLLTDLVDSTTLVERLGDAPAAVLFREHDRLVLDLQQRWRGRLIDRSDGMLLLFERPIDGLAFALDYARGLRAIGEARGMELRARAGLHVGEVLTWHNSAAAVQAGAKPLEVEGLAKPLAGRLMSLARPGQILLSATAEPLARRAARELGERGEHLIWKSYGRWRFKGVPDAQEIFEVGEPGHAPLRAPSHTPKAWRDIPLWRRPVALAAEVAALAVLGVGLWFIVRPQPAIAFAERDWVVVADMRNLTGQAALDDSLEQAFRISLEQSRYVNLLSDLKARDTLARMQRPAGTVLDRAVASEIAVREGARAVILPTVAEVGGRVRVSAEVIDPHTQTTVYAESADGVGAVSALDSIDDVTAALRGKLGEALAAIERDSEPLPHVTTKNMDALRAYALGQGAFGRSRYREALGMYRQAAELDPQFALAYLGMARSHNGLDDLAGGIQHLARARTLRERLPPRERLYLDAWAAQAERPADAATEWRRMAELYPDFFPASANVGNNYYMQNRFAAGLPFSQRATSRRHEFAPLSWDMVGRLNLGLERYEEAQRAFTQAVGHGASTSVVRLANTFAAQRRFDAADKAWPAGSNFESAYSDRVTVYLDSGRWSLALQEARSLRALAAEGSTRARAVQVPLAVVEWLHGRDAVALGILRPVVAEALGAAQAATSRAVAIDEAFLAATAAILAQRMGHQASADQALAWLHRHPHVANSRQVRSLVAVMKAYQLAAAGEPRRAASLLEREIDGGEPVQVHSALLDAYVAAGASDKALSEVRWLAAHRGRAYSEVGCGWCQQPVNVLDTTLAALVAAQVNARDGRLEQARSTLAAFDRHWRPDALPTYLRIRREAVVATFN